MSKHQKHDKTEDRGVVTVTISIDQDVLTAARLVARLSGFKHSFSAYVTNTLKKDQKCLQNSLQSQSASPL